MAGTQSRRSLAKKSIDIMSPAVRQLIRNMPSKEVPACKFLKVLGKRLEEVKTWLSGPLESNSLVELLACLESIYANYITPPPISSLQPERYTHLEDTTSPAKIQQKLKRLAEGKTGDDILLKHTILKKLKAISSMDTVEPVMQTDWRDEMAALYEAFAKHKQCRDITSDTTEALITQLCLSEIRQNGGKGLSISVLILTHKHQRPRDTRVASWRHIEIDVLRPDILSKNQSRTSRTQMTSANTPNENVRQLKRTRDLCKTVNDGIITQLLRLEVRNEKLYFVETLLETTTWVLNKDSVKLSSIIEHKYIKDSTKLRLLISTAISRAVWQVYDSGWWEADCTIDNFRLVWTSSANESSPNLYINKPFFYNTMDELDEDNGNPGCTHSHPMVLALGIILLEVELGTRIQNERSEQDLSTNGDPTPDTDLLVALRLCNDDTRWHNENGLRSIIKKCVLGTIFRRSSAPEDIRQTLFEEIVGPLEGLLTESVRDGSAEEYCIPDACKLFGSCLVEEDSKSVAPQTSDTSTAGDTALTHPTSEYQMISISASTDNHVAGPSSPSNRPIELKSTNETEKGNISIPTQLPDGDLHSTADHRNFDGTLYSVLSNDSSSLIDPELFVKLRQTWKDRLQYKNGDKPIRIAILDTGIDMQGTGPNAIMHAEFRQARAVSFIKGQPCPEPDGIPQVDRVKEKRNFCNDDVDDIQDLDGHGTAVASIVLRLTPQAELVIARICVGDINYGLPEDQWRNAPQGHAVKPRPTIIKNAIEWAIEQQVNIINMSCGFVDDEPQEVQAAIELAHKKNILVFAATSNGTIHNPPAWPAKELSLCIGINSCTPGGHCVSEFTPQAIDKNPNFIVVGERIPVPWLTLKGGGFRLAQGTSFATPVAVAIAAMILTFIHQKQCANNKRSVPQEILSNIGQPWGMASILSKISYPHTLNVSYTQLAPEVFWRGYKDESAKSSREHAWNIIKSALNPSHIFEDKFTIQGQNR